MTEYEQMIADMKSLPRGLDPAILIGEIERLYRENERLTKALTIAVRRELEKQ